ncbi:MAG: serine/threonine-protein kinase [Gemmatales bacterium]|nr:serine/threonine-protein kinase [Gemmatales bacterium]MDW8386414.1 serine/threonine-protein kinase [Gemmatales bacterium]
MSATRTCSAGHRYDAGDSDAACPICAAQQNQQTLAESANHHADPAPTAAFAPSENDVTADFSAAIAQKNRAEPMVESPPPPGQTAASEATAVFQAPSQASSAADNLRTRIESSGASGTTWSAPDSADRIAGYEILDVLGQGGMGIVYKARQPRLNRLVALKMILAGPHAGREQLARFQTEAKAVASLHHPNIVQIHEVGEYSGRQFLALEFVDGAPLDKLLAGKPQDPYQSARLVATLCYAVQAAHDHGIIHRDLKPANILIQKTGTTTTGSRRAGETVQTRSLRKESTLLDPHGSAWGIPKITDFGLAKRMEEQDGNTVTGAIMGTPSYMAPEQATGKTDLIGPAVDIYALGAILYEMLTGRPPFAGVTPLETLRQVQTQDPVPPTRLQPRLPRDLETICLKALQKEPRQRYLSAAEMGQDLERFLAGEPIHARPVSVWVHAWKWTKRRPAAAALIAVSALAIVVVVGIILWSNAQLRASNVRLEAARKRAALNYERSRKAVDELLRAVSNELEDAPLMEATRRRLLEKALGFYEEFLREKGDDPGLQLELARTCGQVGDIYRFLGNLAKSREHYDRMFALAEQLPEPLRNTPDFLADLATAYVGRALVHKALDEVEPAAEDAREGLRLQQKAAELSGHSEPSENALARCYYFLGVVLAAMPGKQDEAEQAYREALRLQRSGSEREQGFEERRQLARTLNNLGLLLARTKRPTEAFAAFEEARKLQRELVASPATRPAYRRELARTCNNIAVLLQADPRRLPEAEAAFAEVRELLQGLVRDFPSVPDYRNDLGMCLANQAMLMRSLRRFDEALAFFDQALQVQRDLIREFPETADYRQRLARSLLSLGNSYRDLRRYGDAETAYREAIALYDALLAENRSPEYLNGSAMVHYGLGRLSGNRLVPLPFAECCNHSALTLIVGLHDLESRTHLHRAVELQQEAVRLQANNTAYRNDLNNYLLGLIQALLGVLDHASAARYARQLHELQPDDAFQAFRAAYWLARCVSVAEEARQNDVDSSSSSSTEAYAEEAVQLLRKAIERGFKDAPSLERPPFDVLHERPDFQKILRQLKETKTPTIAAERTGISWLI